MQWTTVVVVSVEAEEISFLSNHNPVREDSANSHSLASGDEEFSMKYFPVSTVLHL